MKIYFTCSTAEFETRKYTYFGIRNFLVREGHTLTRDWLQKTHDRIRKGNKDLPDIKQIYEECMQAIQDADLVIIEDTVSNFSTGHQITIALQRQKPTLVLWSEAKHRHFKQTFIQGISSEYLMVHEYKKTGYMPIIRKFVNRYGDMNKRNRFHLVLAEPERRYLDWIQFNTGTSRNKKIRQAIINEINKDEEYLNYLSEATEITE